MVPLRKFVQSRFDSVLDPGTLPLIVVCKHTLCAIHSAAKALSCKEKSTSEYHKGTFCLLRTKTHGHLTEAKRNVLLSDEQKFDG